MPPEIGQLLALIQQYGLAIVVAAGAVVVSIYLYRQNKTSWEARIKAESDRADYIEKLRVEERAGRLDAEVRLASNAAALRDATTAFVSAQSLMEKLADREPRRRSG